MTSKYRRHRSNCPPVLTDMIPALRASITQDSDVIYVFESNSTSQVVRDAFNELNKLPNPKLYVVQMTMAQKPLFQTLRKGAKACIFIKGKNIILTGFVISSKLETDKKNTRWTNGELQLPYKVCLSSDKNGIDGISIKNTSYRNKVVTGVTLYENFMAIFGNCPRFSALRHKSSSIQKSPSELAYPKQTPPNYDQHEQTQPKHVNQMQMPSGLPPPPLPPRLYHPLPPGLPPPSLPPGLAYSLPPGLHPPMQIQFGIVPQMHPGIVPPLQVQPGISSYGIVPPLQIPPGYTHPIHHPEHSFRIPGPPISLESFPGNDISSVEKEEEDLLSDAGNSSIIKILDSF